MCAPTNNKAVPSTTTPCSSSNHPPTTPRMRNNQESIVSETPSFEVEVSEIKEEVEVDGIKVVGIKVIVGTVESEVGFEEQPKKEDTGDMEEEQEQEEEQPKLPVVVEFEDPPKEEDGHQTVPEVDDDDDETVVAGVSSSSSSSSSSSNSSSSLPPSTVAAAPQAKTTVLEDATITITGRAEDSSTSVVSIAEKSLVGNVYYADALMPTGLCLALERRKQLWKRGFLLIAAAKRYGGMEASKRTKRVDMIFDELRVNHSRLRLEHGNKFRSRYGGRRSGLDDFCSSGGDGIGIGFGIDSTVDSKSSPSSSLYYLGNKVWGLTDRLCQ